MINEIRSHLHNQKGIPINLITYEIIKQKNKY